jgi:hypothetical protein
MGTEGLLDSGLGNLRREIKEAVGCDDVTIYTFKDAEGGLRISEISCTWTDSEGVGGVSYMDSDPPSFAILFAAERYLAANVLPVTATDEDFEARDRARDQLMELLKGDK